MGWYAGGADPLLLEDDPLLGLEEELAYEDPYVMEQMEKELPVELMSAKPAQFVHAAFRMPREDGLGYEPFSFIGRKHLLAPYNGKTNRLLLKCSRQTEKSTLLGNIALTYSCMVPAHSTLYVSPSSLQTKTFSNDRLKEPLETSATLKRFTTTRLSQNVFEKQFVNRSIIRLRYAFLNADRTRGIRADKLLIDEIQDILYENVPVMEHCLSHANPRWKGSVYSGTPKSLDNTIEWYWANKSTQGEWVVPCDRCGSSAKGAAGRHWNILGEANIQRAGLSCSKCGHIIYPMRKDAQWGFQAEFDEENTPWHSYRINQLMVPWKKWADIFYEYKNNPRDRFFNEALGLSYDSGLRPMTLAQIRSACNPDISMHESQLDKWTRLGYAQPTFMGIDWGCHDEGTRILTEDGFKYFADLTDDDKVAQWDPDTRKMTFTKPKVRTVRDWDQPLLHFKTKGGMDLMVTHTHRMRVGQRQGESWVTESAGETVQRGGNVHFVGHVQWDGEDVEWFTLPGLSSSPGYAGCEPKKFGMDEWVEFLGYMLTEGGVCLKKNSKSELVPYCLKMSQRKTVKPRNYAQIRNCMESLGISFSEFPNPKTGDANWTICGKQYWDWFSKNMGMTGDTKRIPREFLRLTCHQLQILFDAMVLGDGSVDSREDCTGGAYYSTSRGLCEDFQEICIKLGLRCSVSLHKPAEGNHKARYRALWSAGRDHQFNTPRTEVKKVPYNGKVYCCAVETGYIVTERNGKIAYQANTGENTFTVITIGTYVNMKMQVFYVERCTGELLEPKKQLEYIKELANRFNVKIIATDYGGGYDRNDDLMRWCGPKRLVKFQYMARCNKKVSWDPGLLRFKAHRTECMSDIFNALKRKVILLPRFEEFHAKGEEPYATDILNIFSQYSETLRQIQYLHSPDKPDDTLHSIVYMMLGSMLIIPRPDLIVPRKEEKGQPNWGSSYGGPIGQG